MANKARHKVLHVAAEMAPLEKQGGLGDVLGALPKSLVRSGEVDARVLLPAYPGVLENVEKFGYPCVRLPHRVHAALGWRVYSAAVMQADVNGVCVYLLDQPELFTDPKLYPMSLTEESVLPFVFLAYAALELPAVVDWKPGVFHIHDWSAAILPLALRWHRHYKKMADSFDIVLTLHNLAHQGILDHAAIASWGLGSEAFSLEGMEFYGQANILKGAALSCDAITTVSPHYSWDIQTPDGGFGLHGVFSSLRHRLVGILNGIDYDVWSPAADRYIPAAYDKANLAGKAVCRKKLFERCSWTEDDRPVLLFVGRLVQQKGVDIMLSMLEWQLTQSCRAVVIGSGMPQYESWVEYLQRTHPDGFWSFTGFDEEVAHLAYAGSDILMMPSLFEPCGLSQMISMSYGTVPVVRNTGGLADTVIDFDGSPDGTGFIFSDYSAEELGHAVNRAIAAYYDKARWREVTVNAMSADFSWDSATKAYIGMYDGLRNGDSLG